MIHADAGHLTEDQRMMRDSCRAFVDDVVTPFIRRNWRQEWDMSPGDRLPPSILEGAEAIGIRTLGIPEGYGGFDLEPETEVRTFALIAEEVARGDSGLADKLVQNWKVAILLRELAAPETLAEIFPKLRADPQYLMAHALTEPRGASDRWLPYNVPEAAMRTTARQEGDDWVLNGTKHYISNGFDASLYVIYANTDRSRGMLQGTSSFVVPRDTPGLRVTKCNETIGCRYMNNGEIVLEDCRLPASALLVRDTALGGAGKYFRAGKIIQAAKNLGVGVACFERTADFIQTHVQGGRILIKHQAVAIRLADMATRIAAVRALVEKASRAVDENHPEMDVLCNMAKVYASEEIMKVAQHMLELHGGHGAMLENGIEKLFRDAAIFLHMDATVDISHLKIVKAMFPYTAGAYAGPEG